jgi:hypothetical protein
MGRYPIDNHEQVVKRVVGNALLPDAGSLEKLWVTFAHLESKYSRL